MTVIKVIHQYLVVLFVIGLLVLPVKAQTTTSEPIPLAPGYGKLTYPLPTVGSYELPALGVAADGNVLDDTGKSHSLSQLLRNNSKYTLLSFVYSNCSDVNGCPLVSNVFYKVKSAMRLDETLAERLQLITISFDPERDTPEVMRLYGENLKYAGNKGEWRFLTTKSLKKLTPILDAYHQDIQRNLSVNGSENGDISHLLRAYLIAPDLSIHNIYSVGFLHSDLLINDVKTLLQNNSDKKLTSKEVKTHVSSSFLSKAGDEKKGYQNNNYKTNSRSLTARSSKGKEADLLAIANNPPLGLPKLLDSVLSKLTKDKIALGRSLFFDRRAYRSTTPFPARCVMCPNKGLPIMRYQWRLALKVVVYDVTHPLFIMLPMLDDFFMMVERLL